MKWGNDGGTCAVSRSFGGTCCKKIRYALTSKGLVRSGVPARISSQSSRHWWRSPLPRASALSQRDFACVLGVQQKKKLPHAANVVLVCQLGL
ncbi:hypothetical protein TNCV_728201 [Trichonephila clavipes]|nr:hypothetical protein TNCV_728201 [Trichonephila clavipes]